MKAGGRRPVQAQSKKLTTINMGAAEGNDRRDKIMRRFVLPAILILAGAACVSRSEVVFEGEIPTSAAPAAPESAVAPDSAAPTTETAPPSNPASGETAPDRPTENSAAPDAPAPAPVAPLTLSDSPLEAIPGRIVVNGPQVDSVYVLGPDPDPLVLYQEPGGFAAQPTWSPDGGRVAWSQNTGTVPSVVVRSLADDGENKYPTPFAPFYIQWRPDGRALALLGPTLGGTGLAVLDLDRGEVAFKNSALSFYLQWSPRDEDRMITHLDSARLELLRPDGNDVTPLSATPGGFLSAVWTADGRSVAYVKSPDQTGPGPPYQLALLDVESGNAAALAEGNGFFDFDFSPDGRRMAYSVRTLEGETQMFLLDLENGESEKVAAPGVFAWQWSPDSRKILLLGLERGLVSLQVYQMGKITSYQSIVPTDNFLRNYLLFWGQYRLSLDLWAPDSSAFVFTAADRGQDRVFLQRLDDEFPVLLAPGSMAAFSPADPAFLPPAADSEGGDQADEAAGDGGANGANL